MARKLIYGIKWKGEKNIDHYKYKKQFHYHKLKAWEKLQTINLNKAVNSTWKKM